MQSNMDSLTKNEPILSIADVGVGLKYALVVFLVSWLFFYESTGTWGMRDVTFRPGRAAFHGMLVFFVVIGVRALVNWSDIFEREKLEDEVALHRRALLSGIQPQLRLDKSQTSEEVYFELQGVGRYEMRRTRAANIAMGTINGKAGPVRLKAGQLAIDAPEVWRQTDTGVLVATDRRLVFQGVKRRQEWKWHLVGDVVHDTNGLLVWPRNGKPIGLKMPPNPALYAFIRDQLEP